LNNENEISSDEEDWDRGTRGSYNIGNKLISGLSLSVHKENEIMNRKKSKGCMKRDETVRKLNDYKNELKDLNTKYEAEKKRIMSNIERARKDLRESMPKDMTYMAGKLRIERVMEQVVGKHNKDCETFNDKDLDGLIEMPIHPISPAVITNGIKLGISEQSRILNDRNK
jgi:hypothetical protein